MQSATYQHHNQRLAGPLKTQNQFMAHRRDSFKHRSIQVAVREWESTLPGQAQEKIAQLVAEQWTKEGGRGIAVNKQNLFRYLKNEGGSEKYTAYIMQLSGAIVAAMPIEIARSMASVMPERKPSWWRALSKNAVRHIRRSCWAHRCKSLRRRSAKRQSRYSTCYLLTRRDHYWRVSAP